MIDEEQTHEVLNSRLTSIYKGSLDSCRRCAKWMAESDKGASSFHYVVIDSQTTETVEIWHYCCGAGRVGECQNCKAEREMDW